MFVRARFDRFGVADDLFAVDLRFVVDLRLRDLGLEARILLRYSAFWAAVMVTDSDGVGLVTRVPV